MGSIRIMARMWPDTWDTGISVGHHDHFRCRCGGHYGAAMGASTPLERYHLVTIKLPESPFGGASQSLDM